MQYKFIRHFGSDSTSHSRDILAFQCSIDKFQRHDGQRYRIRYVPSDLRGHTNTVSAESFLTSCARYVHPALETYLSDNQGKSSCVSQFYIYLIDDQLKPEAEAEYKALHANAWPGILAALQRHGIADYSIHYYPPLRLLIANYKYTGEDYAKDMNAIGQDEETRKWWRLTDGMQESFNEGAEGSGKDTPWWKVISV